MTERSAAIKDVRRARIRNTALLCAAGLAINAVGAVVSSELNLPTYLDTAGTFLTAALGGCLPGVIVGFFTNLFCALFEPLQIYYGILNMLVALCAAFFTRRGFYEKLPKTLLAALATAIVVTAFGSPLTWFLNHSNLGGVSINFARRMHVEMGFGRFGAQLVTDFLRELLDKTLTSVAIFVVLKLLPKRLKEYFAVSGGLWQTQLTPEMRAAIEPKRKGRQSLRTRMVLVVTVGAFAIAASAVYISLRLYQQSTVQSHIAMADGLASMVSRTIDADRVDEFVELGEAAEGYKDTERKLHDLKNAYPDVEYLYVYRMEEDGCHVVFDLDTPALPGDDPGTVVPFEEAFKPYVDALLRGEPIEPVSSKDSYGWLLSIYRPIHDRTGTTRCYVGVDFSMNLLSVYGDIFFARLISILSSVFLLVFFIGLAIMEGNIILPVNTMAHCAGEFAYNSEEARAGNVQHIRELGICTGDEIENLYRAFLKTTEDSMDYVENLLHARIQVEVMKEQVSAMDELAYKDALTGVRNKTAYDQFMTQKIEAEIAQARANFGIAMIDLNYLKRINDTYGHERGNVYLKECCALVCTVFDHSPVFRVGGDEFVAVLEKDALAHYDELVARFKAEMRRRAEDASIEPWRKVSAAVGVAVYDPAIDDGSDAVFKRADQAMYEDKTAMKAVRTD